MKLSLKAKLNILTTVIFLGLTLSLCIVYLYQQKKLELPGEYLSEDHLYWYKGSVNTLKKDTNYFIRSTYEYNQVEEYMQGKRFAAATTLDDEYFVISYLKTYLLIIFLFYMVFMVIINVMVKKIENIFKFVNQAAQDFQASSERHIEERKLLAYVHSYFNPLRQMSKNLLPKSKHDAFKENHRKSVTGFANLIRKYLEIKKQELLIQLKSRNVLLTKIASDLQDDIAATVTTINHNSDTIKTSKSITRIKKVSEQMRDLSRERLLSFNDVIWSIDSEKDTMNDLLEHMYDLAFDLLLEKNIKVNFKADTFADFQPDVEIRHNVYLIFKEAINNICKHSRTAKVDIFIDKTDDSGFILRIADYGKGFHKKKIQKGKGLHNMKKLAGKIKADLEIETNNGVKISLKVMKTDIQRYGITSLLTPEHSG